MSLVADSAITHAPSFLEGVLADINYVHHTHQALASGDHIHIASPRDHMGETLKSSAADGRPMQCSSRVSNHALALATH